MDTQCSSKRTMSSFKEGKIWLCKWLFVLCKILWNSNSGFQTRSFLNARLCAETTTAAWASNAGKIFFNPDLFCFFAYRAFGADLPEYKQTSYMAAALFIVSQMQVTMITCCLHFNSRAAQGQQLVHHLSSSISFRSFRHNSGEQECVLSSDDSNSLPEGLVTSPVHSFYQMVNINISKAAKSWHKNQQVCIEGAQPEGLEGKSGGDGPELSYLYGREDRFSHYSIP